MPATRKRKSPSSLRDRFIRSVAAESSYHALFEHIAGVAFFMKDGQSRLIAANRHFYERLGWRTWLGPSSVRSPDGERRTPDEDGYILVLTTPSTPLEPLDLTLPIRCDWRVGDVW